MRSLPIPISRMGLDDQIEIRKDDALKRADNAG